MSYLRKHIRFILSFTVLFLAAWSLRSQAETVYHNFTLIDPVARTITAQAWLAVEDGRITETGFGEAPQHEDWQYRDMQGTYALPGFIDAHAHVTTGPMQILFEDGKPVFDNSPVPAVTRNNALIALASGVTTIRNPAGAPAAGDDYLKKLESGEWLGPDMHFAGFAFEPMPIRGGTYYAKDRAGWRSELERQKALGAHYVKLYQGLDAEEIALITNMAHEMELETIAHLDSVSWMTAIDAGVDALTHALPTSADLLPEARREQYRQSRKIPSSTFMYQWFELADMDSPEIAALVAALSEEQVLVDLTLVVNQLMYFHDEAEKHFTAFTPDYMHPALTDYWPGAMDANHAGWTADDYARAHLAMDKVFQFTRKLHEAGVPLLLGTDGGGGGAPYTRELELHEQAGLDRWDVLALATTLNAQRLGLADTGRLEPGYEADAVFLNSNPLQSLANTEDVAYILSDGQVHERDALIEQARDLLEQEQRE